MDSSTLNLWSGPFPVKGVSGRFLLLLWFTEIPVLDVNSVDPDQMLHFDTRLKWVKA